MKRYLVMLSLACTNLLAAHPPHLDLEMTSEEYAQLLRTLPKQKKQKLRFEPAIEEAIAVGTRLSKWIGAINAKRSPEAAIRLTSEATRRGIPIESPSIYNPTIIKEKLTQALASAPLEMRTVVTGSGQLPSSTGLDDETFIKHAREIDKQYQSAARYKSVDHWRTYYIEAARKDVRGYYYLVKNKITAEDLREVTLIPEEQIAPLKEALTMLCLNAPFGSQDKCSNNVEQSFKDNTLTRFYKDHFLWGERNWNAFFEIPVGARRKDVSWSGNTAIVPFNTPSIPKFLPYLKDNIEAEFTWGDWGLKLHFGSFENGPRLIFRPGEVPHVNGLGGNEIVMDSNQPIEEYESQWTIRHEFGHVVGLPDCYHEFYDVSKEAYVNYQLDITDLMCSRAGNMNERIYLELEKAYKQ